MDHHRRILSGLLAAGIAALLSCCTAAPSIRSTEQAGEIRISLQLAIAQDAPQLIEETASEFIRRAEYFSNGELNISLIRSGDIAGTVELGKADFCIIENSSLTGLIPELQTLDLPYIIKNGSYMVSGMNSAQARDRLDNLLGAHCSMQVEYAALTGYTDFAIDAAIDLNDFLSIYKLGTSQQAFTAPVYQNLNLIFQEVHLGDGAAAVARGEVDIADASLGEIIREMEKLKENKEANRLSVLVSGHRTGIAYLLSGISQKNLLTPKQQAAIEQAAVMAAGYCRTMAEKQREAELDQLRGLLGRELDEANVEKYFSMVGEIYQDQEDQILTAFDPQFARILRSDAARHAFPNTGSR